MNGIDKITAKITADTQAEIDALNAQAQAEAAEVTAASKAQADALRRELGEKGAKDAAEREERLASMAQLEGRKAVLAAKQGLLDKAFDRALEKLCSMKEDEYIDLLAKMLVQASSTGREQVVFGQKDRARVGKAAVTRANELLAKQNAQGSEALVDGIKAGVGPKAGAIAEKVGKAVSAVTAIAKGTAMLTLAEETRPIRGGFILLDGKVEVNCAFETLVRLQRTEMAGQVADALFGKQ